MRLNDIKQLEAFLQGTQKLVISLSSIEDKYRCIRETIKRFSYRTCKRSEKRVVFLYLKKLTGYKKVQLYRLIKRALDGSLKRQTYQRENIHCVYTRGDIKLLEKTDELHFRLNREATREILRREYAIFGHKEFEKLSGISSSHIDNLRKTNSYKTTWVNGTKATVVPIGKTMKPEVNNMPGSLRIDTCHQRDVYHVHAVDEITQWEIVICVPAISEAYLKPALELLLEQFPFVIFKAQLL